jgi:hypothetical protein
MTNSSGIPNSSSASQIDALIAELSDWRERALAAEARAADLERKLRGWQKDRDPLDKLKRLGLGKR